MPYNIFGEMFIVGCGCLGCRRIRSNRDHVNGNSYNTRAQARAANDLWVMRNGRQPSHRFVPGSNQHTEQEPPPEVISLTVAYDGPAWLQVDAGGQVWDDGTARELISLLTAVSSGLRWQTWSSRTTRENQLTPVQRKLAGYPNSDPRRSYSWRPDEWRFFGDGPVFYGMEVEIKCRNFRTMQYVGATVRDFGHLKNDSSIGGGFELVTHPMSLAWAMENFPWALLSELAQMECAIDPAVNGIHVHVNRDGFSTPAHTLRWLKFIYRNRTQITRIARRENTRYAGFVKEVRDAQFRHVMLEKARSRLKAAEQTYSRNPSYDNEVAYAEANRELRTLMANDPATSHITRYQAINLRGLETLEMRMFASTLGVLEAKAALQMAAASVEYTRGIRAAQVCKGAWGWVPFSQWLGEHQETYPELVKANRYARMPVSPTATYIMSETPRRGL